MAQEISRKFSNVVWDNPEKTRVAANLVVNYDDGTTNFFTAVVSDVEGGNPDWKAIMEEIGVEDIDNATNEKVTRRNKERQEKRAADEDRKKKQITYDKQEALFSIKLEAFEIEEVKNSKNRELKAKIRKSKSPLEVTAWTTILLNYELNLPKETVEAPKE